MTDHAKKGVLSIEDPTDLSALYFQNTFDTAASYLGPIRVGETAENGRGLFCTTDISLGEPLFVSRAAAHASVESVYQEWASCHDIPAAAERVLVDHVLTEQKNTGMSRMLSFLEGSGIESSIDDVSSSLAQMAGSKINSDNDSTHGQPLLLTRHQIEQIIRRNVFGPEFATFESTKQRWEAGETDYRPPRLLGLYPLAAMINHSCVPNAIRVFVGDMMIVHACQNIAAGEEIVWSYVPLANNSVRHRHLLALDFICQCPRCQAEAHIPPPDYSNVTVDDLEERILPNLPSNEWRRYVRVGCMPVYLDAINAKASDESRDWLPICTQLHLALASCHNASTEHLSILHWCYELAAPAQRKFWVQQLRTAITTRYGMCGGDVEKIRALLQHTRVVLRNRNGLDQVELKFV